MFFHFLNNNIKKFPFLFATIYSGVKNSTADIIVQKYIEKKDKLNYLRLATFTAFSVCYGGAGQFIMLNKIMPRIFPGLLNGNKTAACKALVFDQVIHFPLIYMPTFYFFNQFNYKNFSFKNIQDNWRKNIINDMFVQGIIFIPVQAFNFTENPPHLRIPLLTSVGFIYAIILSSMRCSKSDL